MSKFRIILIIFCITFGINGYSQQFFEHSGQTEASSSVTSTEPFGQYQTMDDPPPPGGPGFPENPPDTAGPIDQWLFVLMAAGAFTGFYFLRKRKEELEVK